MKTGKVKKHQFGSSNYEEWSRVATSKIKFLFANLFFSLEGFFQLGNFS